MSCNTNCSNDFRIYDDTHCENSNIPPASFGGNIAGAPAVTLDGIDFTGVDFKSAKLERTSLIGADLSGADLSGTVLNYVDLTNANLTNANLTNANLFFATLIGTTLTNSNMSGTNLGNVLLNFNGEFQLKVGSSTPINIPGGYSFDDSVSPPVLKKL